MARRSVDEVIDPLPDEERQEGGGGETDMAQPDRALGCVGQSLERRQPRHRNSEAPGDEQQKVERPLEGCCVEIHAT